MSYTIAVAGKGGTGKTTLSSLVIGHFVRAALHDRSAKRTRRKTMPATATARAGPRPPLSGVASPCVFAASVTNQGPEQVRTTWA